MTDPVSIATERLIIRELTPNDLAALLAVTSDPNVVRYLSFGVMNEAETQGVIDFAVAAQAHEPRSHFALAIVDAASGELIGSCGLALADDPPGTAEIYWALREASWGVGFATEAVRAIVDYGLRVLGLHRISAYASPGNPASLRVMEKAGIRYEGLIRGVVFKDGIWHDAVQYAILEDDSCNERKTRFP
jgi:RimJ/RimL family protein N-acetyltransferase